MDSKFVIKSPARLDRAIVRLNAIGVRARRGPCASGRDGFVLAVHHSSREAHVVREVVLAVDPDVVESSHRRHFAWRSRPASA